MCMKIDFGMFATNLIVPFGGGLVSPCLLNPSSSSISYHAYRYNSVNYHSASTKRAMQYTFSYQPMVLRSNLNPFHEQNTTIHLTDNVHLSHQNKTSGIFKTLCEAFKLPTKNYTTIVPVVLISTLASFVIFSFNHLLLVYMTSTFMEKTNSMHPIESNNPENFVLIALVILKFLVKLLSLETIILTISFIIHSLIATSIIHVLSSTYSDEVLSFKDLLSRLSFKGLKGPIITKLYIIILNMAASLPLVIIAMIGYGFHLAKSSVVLMISFGSIPAILAFIFYLYVAMIGSVSAVISVVEDGCYGLEAISKAVKIIEGRRRQGVSLMFVEFAVTGISFLIYSLAKDYIIPDSMSTQLAIRLVYRVIILPLSVFILAMNILFYYDCKIRNEGEGITVYV